MRISPSKARLHALKAVLSLLLSFLLFGISLPSVANAAEIDAEFSIETYVTDHQGAVPTISPGDSFSYTVNLQCSSTESGTCANAVVSTELPQPLALDVPAAVSVSPNVATATVADNKVRVVFNNGGLNAGQLITITVKAKLPSNASADFNGESANAVFTATADNAESVKDAAAVKLDIEPRLDASATKSVSPTATQPAIPGRAVEYTIGGANRSNVSVDALTLADPTDPGAATPFAQLALTDIATLVAPTSADRVAFAWFDGADWHEGDPVAIPADPTSLLPATGLADILGVKFTFTKAGGQLPAGDPAKIVLQTSSRDAFAGVEIGGTLEVTNTVTTKVVRGAAADTESASGSIEFLRQPVQVEVTKAFDEISVVAEKSTSVTVQATTGVMPTSKLTISEPKAGEPNLADQGLTFGGFITAAGADHQLAWPDGATRAEITYAYADGTSQTLATTTTDTLPDPDSARTVVGLTVTFTAADDGIEPKARVVLPFQVTAGPVDVEAGVKSLNTVEAAAVGAAGSDTDTAADDLTRLPERVRTEVTKSFNRDWIWASAGTTATAGLTGEVSADSTIGSTYLDLTDADPTFWDYFDLRRIVSTDVPSNAVLNVQYWDGTAWQALVAATGPQSDWSYRLSTPEREAVKGIRFSFTPKAPATLLPPAFNVAPRFEVALRQTVRSHPETSATTGTDELSNLVTAKVANPAAIEPEVSDTAADQLILKPTGTGGGGGAVDLVEKRWLDPATGSLEEEASISALTDQTRTAVVRWGTSGLSMSSVEVVDDPNYASIASSLYNAFDLVRIRPITTTTDPRIAKDKVSSVALYLDDSGWTDITSSVCGSASACDGVFPGYELTAEQRQHALAVRLTFEPGSKSDTDAVATSGNAFDRQVRYDFQLRRTLRSDSAAYVLGTSHDGTYNSGQKGVASNGVRVEGTLSQPPAAGPAKIASIDSAQITIYDQPLNVSLTKTLDQAALGIPQAATTDPADYPLIGARLVATNNTASGVPEFDVSDPANPGSDWYRYLNLYQIEFGSIPDGLTAADVSVALTLADGSTVTKSYAEAKAMTPAQLAGVVGIVARYGALANLQDSAKPLIPSDARAELLLTYQLRAAQRNADGSAGEPIVQTDDVTNVARSTVVSPGGIGCADAGGGSCNAPTVTDSGQIDIVQPTYTVSAGKSISPAQRYEDESKSYTVTLTGQPTGTARTQLLTLTDATPSFWNAFDFNSVNTVTLPAPVNQLQLSVLTGVDYAVVSGDLVATCAGNPVLDACWHPAGWLTADANRQVTPVLPIGITADQVRGVRFEAQRVVDGTVLQWERPADPKLTISLKADRRALLRFGTGGAADTPVPSTLPGMATAPGETVQGVTTDQLQVSGRAAWRTQNNTPYTAGQTSTDTTKLLHRVNQIKVEKTPGQGSSSIAPRYDLDATIPYQLKLTNTGDWKITGLKVIDQIDLVDQVSGSPLVAADVDPVFTFKLNGATVSGFAASLDAATGKIAITVPADFELAPGAVLLIGANLRFRDRLPAGTVVTNTVAVESARAFEKCESTHDAKAADALTGQVTSCAADTTVVAAASTPISIAKSVKAADGDLGVIAVGATDASACTSADADGYYTAPCVPITRAGEKETWRLSLSNNGNVAANTISAIDVLPAPGDTGVTVSTPRKSRFTPAFLGNVKAHGLGGAAPHTLKTYYATTLSGATCNKSDILNDTRPDGQSNCGIAWTEFSDATPAATLAKAVAIKVVLAFDDPADGLAPGTPLYVTFDTRTPAYAESPDASTVEPVAWNSVAVGSRTAASESFPARASLITEPRKVGVALASGQVELAKAVAAPAGAAWLGLLPSGYPVTVQCESLGEQVPLRTATGAAANTVTLAASGAVQVFNGGGTVNLPLGAECKLTETAGQGAVASFTPAKVIAQHDYTAVPNVANQSPATIGRLTVTNTYADAGFTVTKQVDGPAALQADGSTAVVFKDFAFTASCTFLGHEVVPVADRTFTLKPGGSKPFANLPAGADCTVAETYAAGSGHTSVQTSQGGSVVDSDADGSGTQFSLVAGDATATSVAYTNAYTVGAATITKNVTGPGAAAWGNEDFQVQLVCTHPDATPNQVFSGTRTLTKASPTWTVPNLASGSSCTVTEPKTGGANETTITGGSFTVGTDPAKPSAVGVTNYFGTGTVSVTKKVQANGSAVAATTAPWSAGSFPVTLACTRKVNGTDVAVAIPGDAKKSLTKAGAWTASWTNLPAGATCAVTEDEPTAAVTGVAGQPKPTVTTSAVQVVADGKTAAFTITNNYAAGKLKIGKTLTGAGTSFFSGATFAIVCKLDETTVLDTTTTVAKGASASAELGPIPFGADCTVKETNTGGADFTPADQQVTITENAATANLTTLSFTNTFSAGTVLVTKVLDGQAAGEDWAKNATFTFAVNCGTSAANITYTGNVTIKGAGSSLVPNNTSPKLLPVGTSCWASETAKGGAGSTKVVPSAYDASGAVTAQPNASVSQVLGITATNTYEYAGLTVSKTVAGASAQDQSGQTIAYPTSVSFTARCTFNNGTTTRVILDNEPFTITGTGNGTWGSWTKDRLPVGASCVITETTPALAPAIGYVVTRSGVTPNVTGATAATTAFTLVKGDAGVTTGDPAGNKAAFTNTYSVGKLQVVKKLNPTSTVWATAPFTLQVVCKVDFPVTGTTIYTKDFSFNVSASGSYSLPVIDNLPAGAKCTTTETRTGGANGSPGYDVQTQTIVKAATVTTNVTNTFNTGSVTITKATNVNGTVTTAQPWASTKYTMRLSCTRMVDGVSEELTISPASQVITGSGSVTWTGLPEGAVCAATETKIDYPVNTPEQPEPTVTYSSPATVGNGTTVGQTVTNDFAFGSVQIRKAVTGDAAAKWGTGTFGYTVNCTLAGTAGSVYSKSVTLSQAGGLESALLGPVPKGAICTVAETASAGATSVEPASQQRVLDAIEAGGVRVANFENRFDFAGFKVTKTVHDGGAVDQSATPVAYAATYRFKASCTHNGVTVLNEPNFALKGGESKEFTGLPVGAACAVTETSAGNAPSTSYRIYRNGTAQAPVNGLTSTFDLVSGTGAIPPTSADATAVVFTNAYTVGGLAITKTVTGKGAANWSGGRFTVALKCTLDHDADASTAEVTVFDATRQLARDETWSVSSLPTGAHCAISEPKVGGSNQQSISPAAVTVGTGVQAVAVTNTFNTGSVRVTKSIANGLGTLAPWKNTGYELTLACTKDFDGDGTPESFAVPGAVKTVTGTGSVQWDGLPQGAVCGVTETRISYPDTTPAQPDPTVSYSGAVTVDADQVVTQVVTNTFGVAKVKVTKEISGAAATTWGTGAFRFHVACSLAGSGEVYATDVTLTPATGQTSLASAELGPVPQGATCAVTETDTAGATSVEPAAKTRTLSSVLAGQTATAAFDNRFDFAGFTVTKAVVSEARNQAGQPIAYAPASFTASCTFQGAEAIKLASDRSFTLTSGASKTFIGLPAGADCTVTEVGASGAARTEVAVTQGANPVISAQPTQARFGLVPGGADATAVGFTNHYNVGSLKVTKTVAGDGAARWGGAKFAVSVRCTLADASPSQVFDGSTELSKDVPTWTIPNLPTGADCQVSETRDGGANGTTVTGGTRTIGDGTTVNTGITNTFTLGAIEVGKALTVNGATTTAKPWTEGSYTVRLACTKDFDGDGTAEAIDIPDGATRTITGAGTARFADLPTGAKCALTETASSPKAQGTTISPGGVTVGDDPEEPQAFTVVNDFHTGSLSVLKQLAGAGEPAFGDGPFSFKVTCTLAGAKDPVYATTFSLSRTAGSTATSLRKDDLGPVPVGAECLVEETDRGGADATPAPVTVTIAADASGNLATFTNQFSAGTIWLSKTLDGGAKAESWATAATFKVLVTCQVEVGSEFGTVFSREVSIQGGQRLNVLAADGKPSRVPLGSHCWTTETDAQGAGATSATHHDWGSAVVVTAGTPSALQALELGVTNTFEYAGFTVTKTVANGGAVDAANAGIAYPATFRYTAECTFNGTTVLNQAFDLVDGGSRPFTGLPAGTDCAVAETGTGNAASTSIAVTQAGAPLATGGLAAFRLVRGGGADPASAGVTVAVFTNHYTVGALTITKRLTGAGAPAWGGAAFTVKLVCTLDTDANPATDPVPVFADSRDLSVTAGLVWSVPNLPTGARCVTTETAHGGANDTVITNGDTIVGNQPASPAQVTVTNEFTLGSVLVSKRVLVDGSAAPAAEPYRSAANQLKLKCTRLVNGVVEAVDVPHDAYPAGHDLDGVRTVTGSGSYRYDDLPTGAACQASEVGTDFALPSAQVAISQPQPVAAAAVADAVVTNDYHTGTLQVVKSLVGAGVPDWSAADFTFDVVCRLADAAGDQHEVFRRGGIVLNQADGLASAVFTGIPVGADCVVTETASGGADVPATSASVPIVDGKDNVATLTNEFNLGVLKVTLGLTLDGLPTTAAPFAGGSYQVAVTCTRVVNGEQVPVNVPGGGVWTFASPTDREHVFTGLPVGASCAVHQDSASLTPQDVTFTPTNAEPSGVGSGPVVITADAAAPAVVGVVDHFLTRTVTVTKALLGAGAAGHAMHPFTFSIQCTLTETGVAVPHPVFDQEFSLSVADGLTSDPLGPIPVGSDCAVTETGTGGATIAAAPAELTISETAANAVTMTNGFDTGSVVVTKVITVDGKPSAREPYASGRYTVTLTCTQPVDGVEMAVTVPGGASRTITGAGQAVFAGLPLGADCAVAETGTTLAVPSDQVTVSAAKVTVGEEPIESVITNDYRSASLLVEWHQTGVGTSFAGPATFVVDCTLDGANGSVFHREVTLNPESSAPRTLAVPAAAGVTSPVLGPIPVGAKCTVTQTGADGADALAAPVVATGSTSLLAVFTNEYSAGTLTLTKQLTGAGAKAEAFSEFRFAVTCLRGDGSPVYAGEAKVIGAAAVTIGDASGQPLLLPAGTRCWADETETGGAYRHQVDHSGPETALGVATGQPNALQQLVITAVNEFRKSDAVDGSDDTDGDANDSLAFTGFVGWGAAGLGLAFLLAGAWLVRRRRA